MGRRSLASNSESTRGKGGRKEGGWMPTRVAIFELRSMHDHYDSLFMHDRYDSRLKPTRVGARSLCQHVYASLLLILFSPRLRASAGSVHIIWSWPSTDNGQLMAMLCRIRCSTVRSVPLLFCSFLHCSPFFHLQFKCARDCPRLCCLKS